MNDAGTSTDLVADDTGNEIWSQDIPTKMAGEYLIAPRADGDRVVTLGGMVTDGGTTAYSAVVDRDGSAAFIPIAGLVGCRYAPSGSVLACGTNTGDIVTLNDDGSNMSVVAHSSPGHSLGSPTFSFDGRHVAFLDGPDSGHAGIDVVDLVTVTARVVDAILDWKFTPFFTPDGSAIVFAHPSTALTGSYNLLSVDVETGTRTTLLNDMGYGGYLPPSISIATD